MDQLFSIISRIMGKYSLAQRMVIVTVVIGIIAVIVSLVTWANKPEFTVLYTNLEPSVADNMISEIRSDSIPFKLEDNGKTILVPAGNVDELRLTLAGKGMTGSLTEGWKVFDNQKIGQTTFMQKINMRRALEGELAKTISQFEVIKSCRVHLNLPEGKLFEKENSGSASVALNLKPGNTLNSLQIKGITSLVANCVDGITKDNVVLLDADGKLLNKNSSDDAALGTVANQWEMKNTLEEKYKNKVNKILESIVGPNRAVVEVSVELNFEQVERTAEIYDPDNVAIISEERHTESTSSSDTLSSSSQHHTNEDLLTNYEINKTVEHYQNNVGAIQKLSVAVAVDGYYKVSTGANGEKTKEYVARNQSELDQISALVASAVGYSAERGDMVEVKNMRFDRSGANADDEFAQASFTGEMWANIINKVLVGLSILIALFVMRKLLKSTTTIFPELAAATTTAALPGVESLTGLTSGVDEREVSEDAYITKLSPEARAKLKAKDRMTEDVVTYAKESPEDAARLIRSWLTQMQMQQ
ncbi:MAG: flagellar M-ring protein FliF [FCB group bacterium]|nr:flagellar M-ring protein FliF [FCB group bacterium]